ncbi:hypothetical protein DKX38_023401 [Salix brachista]|uniref:F-box domain-containing protein n=1 Tax=Salix brachista TaxID=2182728 RepID=A0A5N5JJR6_9ROSI|nr:hypothetical protein DKX38_023401 [Salix brachista]
MQTFQNSDFLSLTKSSLPLEMIAEILIRLPEKELLCYSVYVIGFGYDCVWNDYKVVRIAQFGSGGRGVSLGLRSLVSPVNRRIQISGNTDQELENRTGHKKRGRDEIVKIFLPLFELPKAGFEYRSDPQCVCLYRSAGEIPEGYRLV